MERSRVRTRIRDSGVDVFEGSLKELQQKPENWLKKMGTRL